MAIIEETELAHFSKFFSSMDKAPDGDATLLDRTVVLSASNLGNASAHTCQNLPIFLAGSGFKHQGHVLHNREKNSPLANLFVRMLQQLGVEEDRFGENTGAIGDVWPLPPIRSTPIPFKAHHNATRRGVRRRRPYRIHLHA